MFASYRRRRWCTHGRCSFLRTTSASWTLSCTRTPLTNPLCPVRTPHQCSALERLGPFVTTPPATTITNTLARCAQTRRRNLSRSPCTPRNSRWAGVGRGGGGKARAARLVLTVRVSLAASGKVVQWAAGHEHPHRRLRCECSCVKVCVLARVFVRECQLFPC